MYLLEPVNAETDGGSPVIGVAEEVIVDACALEREAALQEPAEVPHGRPGNDALNHGGCDPDLVLVVLEEPVDAPPVDMSIEEHQEDLMWVERIAFTEKEAND